LRENGFPVKHAKALPHVKAAAEVGDAWAQNVYGVMLEHGLATEADPATALKWFRLSAEQGHAKGQSNAGKLLRKRNPGDREIIEAWCWLKLASEQGETTAIAELKDFEPSLTDAQKNEASGEIETYRKKVQSKRSAIQNQ
jgi:TPR repeat protein